MTPFIVTRQEIDWLACALPPVGYYRSMLQYAALTWLKGFAVLATTDVHRLHVLRLGEAIPFSTQLVDVRRLLREMVAEMLEYASISDTAVKVGNANDDLMRPLWAPAFPEEKGTYPNIERAIPTTEKPASELYAINGKYLADAVRIADDNKVVIFHEGGAQQPLLIRPPKQDARWLAVVMPMAINS